MSRRSTGILGEKLAREMLSQRGYRILGTNCRCPGGEIDIIAQQDEALVFVEVRTKTTREYGTPEESITPAKRRKLRTAAMQYLEKLDKQPLSWRIDVVAVELGENKKPVRVEVIENAVGEE